MENQEQNIIQPEVQTECVEFAGTERVEGVEGSENTELTERVEFTTTECSDVVADVEFAENAEHTESAESISCFRRWWGEWRCMSMGERAANVVLAMFHPLSVSMYLALLLLFGRLLTIHMSLRLNMHVLTIVAVNTVLIPCVYLFLLKTVHRMKVDWVKDYKPMHERMLLLLMLAIGFGVSAWNFKGVEVFFIFRRIMVALMMCVVLAGVLDWFKCADFHLLGMGAMTGAVWIMIYAGYEKMVVPFCVILFCSGLVASAYIYLSRSSLLRIAINYFSAILLTAFTILLA